MNQSIVTENYDVKIEDVSKRFFVKKKEKDGTIKSIPITRTKRIVQLKHTSGNIVEFSRYNHGGGIYFRDSRDKSGKETPVYVLAEMQRMLQMPEKDVREMIGA